MPNSFHPKGDHPGSEPFHPEGELFHLEGELVNNGGYRGGDPRPEMAPEQILTAHFQAPTELKKMTKNVTPWPLQVSPPKRTFVGRAGQVCDVCARDNPTKS